MCTVFFLRDLGLLSKNRDKERQDREEVVSTTDLVAVCTAGTDYFSMAVNRHGVAFVSTAVNSPEWTRAVEEGRATDAVAIMAEERKGLSSPTRHLSPAFAHIRSVTEGRAALAAGPGPWMGYHVVLADAAEAVVVECYRDGTSERALERRDAVTNHFRFLDHGAKVHAEYPSSFERLDYAREKLPGITSLSDLQATINPPDGEDARRIWRNGAFSTVSSAIIGLAGRCLWRSEGAGLPFVRHGLTQS